MPPKYSGRLHHVTVARHEAVHLVSSAIVKRCEPVNITRLRCSRLFYIAEMSVVAFDRLEPGAELLEYIALS